MEGWTSAWGLSAAFWGFLLVYGALLYAVSPRAVTLRSFFQGADADGQPVATVPLTLSVFISWIFAKSVTVAANLGADYGVVGALAYATYWLSIPVAGLVIFWIRRRLQATSMVGFLIQRYGRAAAAAFMLAILIRLYNEVWSNASVVAGYFGTPEDPSLIAALVFTGITVAYSAKGGLRSSLITDALQAVLFVFFLALVLFLVLPDYGVTRLATTGSWQLGGGVDLLLVAGLQVVSYPFHDPVLTDRGFINRERAMLTAFVIAGVLGFVAIAGFGLVGVHAQLAGLEAVGDNVPAAVGRSLGVTTFFFMGVIMISSAGSTLDSTFSSLSKSLAWDLSRLRGHTSASVRGGVLVMLAFAVIGNLPLLLEAEILKATTISGTMVMGLAPAFLLFPLCGYSPASFHLSFWTGLVLGIAHTLDALPGWTAIGDGPYAGLLGVNAWGLALCTLGYVLPLIARRGRT